MTCPKCNGKINKDGFVKGKHQYECLECGRKTLYPLTILDKKQGEYNWREWTPTMQALQSLDKKASFSQDVANIEIQSNKRYIIILPLADLHIGSISTNYDTLLKFTEYILENDNVYTVLVGDIADNFVNFKNVLAMHQQILSPDKQEQFIESWLDEIAHKVLATGWGNHDAFEERFTGKNGIKKLLSRRFVYFNGIGTIYLKLNKVDYKIVLTHSTRGYSSFNLTHGLKRLARQIIGDADLYITGHIHTPAMETCCERGQVQTFLVTGTIKHDGYSKRYFDINHYEYFPCLVMDTVEKNVIPFFELQSAIEYSKL